MNFKTILTVYLKELRDSLRDRRTLISIIVIPTFVMPAFFFGVTKIAMGIFSKASQEIPTVMVIGGEDSPGVIAELKLSKKLRIVPMAADWKQQISDKQVRAAVRFPPGFEAGLKAGAADQVVIYHYMDELKSGFALAELERFFRDLRDRTVTARLT